MRMSLACQQEALLVLAKAMRRFCVVWIQTVLFKRDVFIQMTSEEWYYDVFDEYVTVLKNYWSVDGMTYIFTLFKWRQLEKWGSKW